MSVPRKLAALAVAATALAAAAAIPAAAAQHPRIDPRVYSSDVPAGQVEHGVVAYTTTGVKPGYERNDRIEYWATSTRYRTRQTDVRTGAVRAESFFDGRETVTFAGGRISRFKGQESFPGPGWPSAYNRKLVDCGELEQVGERTIAGLPGVVYRVRPDHKTNDPKTTDECKWTTDSVETQTELVFEAGTLRPLGRSNTLENNGAPGRTFRQDETLVSRESAPASGALAARLSAAAKRSAVRAWEAKAAKRRHR